MEVKPGYKRTEVGVIPEEWEVVATADLVEPTAPICYGVVQVGQDTNGGVPIVAIKYVKEIASSPLHRTSATLEQPYARSRVRGGDVLISIKGTIGRVGIVPEGFEGNISRELARLRLKPNYSAEYVAQQLEADLTQGRIARSVVGTTRLEFSIATLRKFELAVPTSRDEQRSIATALSDMAGLLGGLNRLIAKKRDLKQAARQQLLTGQTRLPGFHGEWAVKLLRDCARFCSGTYLAQAAYRDGEFEVQGAGGPMGKHVAANFPEPISVIGRVGTVGRPRFIPNGCWVNNNAAAVAAIPGIASPRFIHLLLMTMDWGRATSVTAQPFLVVESLMKMEFALPPVPEQNAIAEALAEMDAELAALEQWREKTHNLKQAVMQELLTGKTRLIGSQEAAA